jgi:transitional endoplasmic reticulum ATPase
MRKARKEPDKKPAATPAGKTLEERLTWDDVGGCDEAKRELRLLGQALQHPELWPIFGYTPPRGILLYGPPGTGKTWLMKVFADTVPFDVYMLTSTEVGSEFIHKTASELEKRLRYVEKVARSKDEHVFLYVDELDTILTGRDESGTAVRDQAEIVGAFNSFLDGLTPASKVIVVASTNKVKLIDDASSREGRFDLKIPVGLPDERGREDIYRIHCRKRFGTLPPGIDYAVLAQLSGGFSGAKIASIVQQACGERFYEAISSHPRPEELKAYAAKMRGRIALTTEDFIRKIEDAHKHAAEEDASETDGRGRIGFRP